MRAEISQELEEEVLTFLIEREEVFMNQHTVVVSDASIESNLL